MAIEGPGALHQILCVCLTLMLAGLECVSSHLVLCAARCLSGWPRLYHNCPNRCGLNYMPDMVRNAFIDESSESTPDGRLWPRPTPVLMEEGDACFTVFHCPHTASRNALGLESRKNIIFRIRAKEHNPFCPQPVNGVSDHPVSTQATCRCL